MHIPNHGINAFAGPRAPRSAVEIADDLARSFQGFRDRIDARLRTFEDRFQHQDADLVKQSKMVARLQLGGAPQDQTSAATRLEVFNTALRERHGSGARQLTADEWTEYNGALAAYFRGGENALNNPDIRAALSVGSDPAGGYTVISDVDPQPRERLFRTSPMRAVADVITITSGTFEGVHEVGEDDCGWVGESETRAETASGNLGAFRIDADEVYALIPVTQLLLEDSAIDIGQYLERRISRRFMRAENTAFVSGDGIKKPRGFLSYKDTAETAGDASRSWGALQYVPTGAAGAFPTLSNGAADVGCLYDIKAALNAELRVDAVWAMNSGTFAFLEKLKDADGRSLIRQSLDAATPDRILGYPVVIFEDMPDVGSDTFSIAFGNFMTGYQIVEKPGIRMLRDPYTTKGKVKFYAWKRVGGAVVNFDAIKLLKFAAS